MTIEEFIIQLKEAGYEITSRQMETPPVQQKTYLSGVKELAAFLHCSVSTAQRKLGNHEFDFCLYRTGQKLLFDKEQLLEGLKAERVTLRTVKQKTHKVQPLNAGTLKQIR